jgi:hypothetical protein
MKTWLLYIIENYIKPYIYHIIPVLTTYIHILLLILPNPCCYCLHFYKHYLMYIDKQLYLSFKLKVPWKISRDTWWNIWFLFSQEITIQPSLFLFCFLKKNSIDDPCNIIVYLCTSDNAYKNEDNNNMDLVELTKEYVYMWLPTLSSIWSSFSLLFRAVYSFSIL